MNKAHYVTTHTQHDGTHECHGGCGKSVAPAFWGCSGCWYRLPKVLRAKVWAAYRPSQEIDKQPSPRYLEVAREVQEWIKAHPVPQSSQGRLL